MKSDNKPRVGSLVEISVPNGLSLVNGRTVQDWTKIRARVYIINDDNSIVCASKGREASPRVANKWKVIRF